jgi:hypothetical protein
MGLSGLFNSRQNAQSVFLDRDLDETEMYRRQFEMRPRGARLDGHPFSGSIHLCRKDLPRFERKRVYAAKVRNVSKVGSQILKPPRSLILPAGKQTPAASKHLPGLTAS